MNRPGAEEVRLWRERIAASSEDASLLQIAREAPGVELKIEAIQALRQEASMRQAMHAFREGDKRLYRAARTCWQAVVEKGEAHAAARALIAQAQALLEQALVPANRVAEIDREWAALNQACFEAGSPEAELPVRFAELRAQLGSRVRARGESEQVLTRWLATSDEAMGALRAGLPGVAQGELPPAEAEVPAARLLALLNEAPDASDARCAHKLEDAKRALALASSVAQRAGFLASLPAPGAAGEAAEKQAIERWRGFPEVSEGELHTVLSQRFADWRNASELARQHTQDAQRAHEREQRKEQEAQRSSALRREVEAGEAALAAGNLAELTRLLGVIDEALARGPANAGLARRIEFLHREHQRLRGWQRWSGRQQREELANEARALAQAAAGAKLAIQAHGEAISKLRDRWKEIDRQGGASEQALWRAFDEALTAAYAPVAAHLEKQKLARQENLEARNRIIATLAETAAKFFPPAPDPAAEAAPRAAAPDWRAVASALDEAQLAWRKLGPLEHTVPRKALHGEHSVLARHAAAVQALQAPLDGAWVEARAQRERLIVAAGALAGPGAQARDLVDKVRRLQGEWQAAARAMPLPRRDENALWIRFKAATDALFAAREAARAAAETAQAEQSKAREEIIARLDEKTRSLAGAAGAQELRRALAEADAAWRACAPVPKPLVAKLEARYRAARDALSRRLEELALQASQARFDALLAALELCREREAARDADAALDPERITAFEARWNAIEQFPEAWRARLEPRFRETAAAPAPAATGARRDKGAAAPAALPEILLALENACGIDSPAEFLAARQHMKLRALKDAMEGRQAAATTPADIERWLLEAAAAPRPDAVSRERLEKIVAAAKRRRVG
ncbi:MAG: DUF349 domain-containing protein [Burkholderiales bacterium]|nr:DUF349 domain-containing protein [Burkholderiales bacterium]